MNFHAEFFPRPLAKKITYKYRMLLVGSCFTEQMGSKLALHKFNVLENPNGILFNPVSIARAVSSYAAGTVYQETDLFYHNELWGSWQHHTKFSNIEKGKALEEINKSQETANDFIKTANWLMITLGSAFVYENTATDQRQVVANCHKVPTDRFYRRLLEPQEIKQVLLDMMETVKAVNPTANFIFTISPVRHLREGFVENNRSKAALIQAVHSLTDNDQAFYFPAYELIIDDLRDYRFFAEDLVHPNHAATNYVWEKFVTTCIDEGSRQLMKEIAVVMAAKNHKAFNPLSEQHKKFLLGNLEKVKKLQADFPELNFEAEALFFEGSHS